MTIKGRIIDSNTRSAIPGANIALIDNNGKYLGQAVASDIDGGFGLVSNKINGNLVVISNTGYKGVIVDPSLLTGEGPVVALQRTGQAATTQTGLKAALPWWLLAALAGVSAVALSRPAGRRTIGDTGGIDWSKFVIPVGVVVGGGIVLFKVLDKVGLGGPTPEEKAQAAASEAARLQQIKDSAAVQNTAGNYTNDTLKSIASQIAAATSGYFYDYKNLISSIAYFSGFRAVDAIKFLGYFSDQNGYTLKRWWDDKIKGGINIADADVLFNAQKYAANFRTMGVTDLGLWSAEPDQVLLTAISYVYRVAHTSVQ